MLLIGPPGSGKTHWILERLAAAVRDGRGARVRLITPTASMARHLLHELARQGLTVPGDLALPIRRAVVELTPELKAPTPEIVEWLLSRAVEAKGARLGPAGGAPGALRRMARAIDDLEAARVSPDTLRKQARTPFDRAFAEVFALYESSLAVQGFVSSPERRFRAAEEAVFEGFLGAEEIYFDGFFDFSPAERDLVRSLALSGARVAATLPDTLLDTAAAKPAAGLFPDFERKEFGVVHRTPPPPEVFVARGLEAELAEVARRILAERRGGRLLREIGVILRSPETYATTLQAVFERFGIPFRLRRARPAAALEPIALLRDLLQAARDGFPGEATLEALRRPASKIGAHSRAASFAGRVRKALPFEGLDTFVSHAGSDSRSVLDGVAELDAWRSTRAAPAEWAARMQRLSDTQVAFPAAPEFSSPERPLELRAFGVALAAWRSACGQAVEFLGHKSRAEVGFKEWVEALEAVLAGARTAVPDDRRDVVNVLSVHEARQWELPAVFVCGMVEGWFPAAPPEDVFLNDALRKRLRATGAEVRTRAEIVHDERLLYGIATTRASHTLVLSYPELDGASAPLLRSFFLPPAPEDGDPVARLVAPEESAADDPAHSGARLEDPLLLPTLAQRHPHLSPSSLSKFQACPFEFFANKTLRLDALPPTVSKRLDALQKGNILHAALARWSRDRSRPIGDALDEAFAEALEKLNLKPSFLTAVSAAALRADLLRFVSEPESRAFTGALSERIEDAVSYVIDPDSPTALEIRCRIDRYETFDGETALVIDYKSGTSRVPKLAEGERSGDVLQGALYLAGLREQGLRPGGMLYIGLRGKTVIAGSLRDDILVDWEAPKTGVERVSAVELDRIVGIARDRVAEQAARIRAGDIEVTPPDPDHCRKYCDYRDICRVELKS